MSYMLVSDEIQIATEWNKYKGYTVRPVPGVEEYYRKLINRQHPMARFMMYGGTPEIRTLFQQSQRSVVMVDKSRVMINAMGLLTACQIAISDNERFVESDWLRITEQDKQFDVLIGDDAINMVPWLSFELFLQNAVRLLDVNGIFICHLLVKPDDELIHKSLNTIKDEYHSGLIKSKYDLASRLNFTCYDLTDYGMGWQRTIRMLGEDNLRHFKPDLDFVDTFKRCNSHFYCPPQSEFEQLVNRYFSIEEIFYPHEYDYCLFEPVYFLRKRSV